MIATRSVTHNQALETVPVFTCCGEFFFINVTGQHRHSGAGLAPMMQDMFPEDALGSRWRLVSLISGGVQRGRTILLGVAYPDYIGLRHCDTCTSLLRGPGRPVPADSAAGGEASNWSVFLASLFVVFTMYDSGFATIRISRRPCSTSLEAVGAIHWRAAVRAGLPPPAAGPADHHRAVWRTKPKPRWPRRAPGNPHLRYAHSKCWRQLLSIDFVLTRYLVRPLRSVKAS